MPANYVTPDGLKATGISLIVITSLVAGARLAVSILRPKKFLWEDAWLLAAYVFFMVVAILYQVVSPTIFRLEALANGELEPYPTVMDDALFIQQIFFVVTSGLWFTLWCVKASLLALYKRLMTGVKLYIMFWWIVVGISFVFLVGAVTSSMLSCSSMKAWFTAGACGTPRDIKAASISLWYSFAVDVVTDLMIMLLPIALIRKLQMPLAQKLSISALFCLGWVIIAVAIIRVKELGSTVTQNSAPSTSWLALWGTVEASIAVIIGCCPGIYRIAKKKYQTYKASSYNQYGGPGKYNVNSHGYARYTGDSQNGEAGGKGNVERNNFGPGVDVHLNYIQNKAARVRTTVKGGSKSYFEDGASSQEELADDKGRKSVDRREGGSGVHAEGGIKVTKSVTVAHDAESRGDEDSADGIGLARWREN